MNNIFVILFYLVKAWLDERLAWDPDEYDDLEIIPTSADSIWTPMLILENT
jgi:hypothetical protein